MTKSICFINQKGGVGKTSCCFHLAGAFAASGHRVLIVDVDPQGSASQGFLGSEAVERLPAERCVTALFRDSWMIGDWSQLIHSTAFDGIDVCPANQTLGHFNTPCPETTGTCQYALSEFIESRTGYDIILIDCPPNLYRCSWTALIASDYALIPVTPEDFGTQGLRAVHEAIENVRSLKPSLETLGHVVTRSDGRLLVHKFYEQRLRRLRGDDVLENLLPELSVFKLAVANRTPADRYNKMSRSACLTRKLSREILDRMDETNSRRRVA
jgi:chromosome partitioning protein